MQIAIRWLAVFVLCGICGSAFAQSSQVAAVTVNASHSNSVWEIVFSPDGRWLASGGDDAIKLWDVASGRLLRTIAVPKMSQLSVTPDGKRIVAYGRDSLHVWDAETGAAVRDIALPTYEHSPTRHVVTPNGDVVTVRVQGHVQRMNRWDIASGRHLGEFASAGIMNRSVAGLSFFSPVAMSISRDGGSIVLGYSKHYQRPLARVELLDAATGRIVRTFDSHTKSINAAILSPDNRLLASSSDDGTVKIWDAANGRLLHTLSSHGDAVKQLSFSQDGHRLVSGSIDKTLRVWDAKSGALVRTISSKASVYAVSFSPDGRLIASEGDSNGVSLWDSETGLLVRTLGGSSDDIAVFAAPDDRLITSIEDGRWIRAWNARTGQILDTYSRDRDGFGWPRAASGGGPQGAPIIAFQKDASVRLWNASSGRDVASLALSGDERIQALGPGGGLLASENYRGKAISLVDVASGRSAWTNKLPDTALNYAFSPDGRALAALIHDQKFVYSIRTWDVQSGRPARPIVDPDFGLDPKKSASKLVYSPDGRKLVGWGEVLRVFDAASGRKLWEGRGSELNIAAVSPDSRLVVAAGEDTTVTVWDLATGRRHHTLAGSPGSGKSITFLNNGGQVVVGNSNGTSAIWATDTGEFLATTVHAASGEWVTITPEGFFVASEKGGEFLHVVRGFEVTGIDQVYQSLYRPDLIREKLAGDPKGLVREAAGKLDLDKVMASGGAPSARIVSPNAGTRLTADQITAEAEIVDKGGGIGRIEWRVNGITLGVEMRGLVRAEGAFSAGAAIIVRRDLFLEPGDNLIEVVAYNAKGLIASTPAGVKITREGVPVAQAEQKPRLHVLAVGVNEYFDSRLRLTYAVPDARALGDALREAGEKVYDRAEITTVLDAEVTAANLDKVFGTIAKKVRPSDVFVFFLAGHGKTVDGRYYFLPQDFRYQGEESIAQRGVGQDRWQEWFARIPARKSILLYDTCESGTLTGDRVAQRGLERVASLDRMTQAMGRTILTASTDDAPALEGYRGHGVFTYALLDAIGRADANGNGLIEITELASHVDQQVPELSFQAFKLRQLPQMKIVGSNFPLVRQVVVLPQGSAANAASISPKPTHVVIAPAEVFTRAAGGPSMQSLSPGTVVTLVKTEAGWSLVAKDGRALGYVAAKNLAPMQ